MYGYSLRMLDRTPVLLSSPGNFSDICDQAVRIRTVPAVERHDEHLDCAWCWGRDCQLIGGGDSFVISLSSTAKNEMGSQRGMCRVAAELSSNERSAVGWRPPPVL